MRRTDERLDRTGRGVVLRGLDGGSLDTTLRPALNDLLGARTGRAVVCARLHQPTPVSREVLEHVVDALIDAGCTDVTLGSSLSAQDRDRGHRSVSGLAHLAGLTGRTASGRAYEVADLGDDTIPAPGPPSSVLDGRPVSRRWAGASTRVVVGRAVTDLLETYAGCLDALTGVAPEVGGAEPADVVVDVVRHLAPSLCVLDATATSGGADGARLAHPSDTATVVVTSDALLADTALASLLGVDWGASRLVERALSEIGPPRGRIRGDVTRFADVTRPHPLAVEAARLATVDRRLERVLAASIGGPDDGATADDPVMAAVRAVLTPAVAAAADPVGQGALVGLLAGVATASVADRAWSVNLDKDRVPHRVVPLGFEPAAHPNEDYDDLPTFLAVIDDALAGLPAPADGEMRWTLVDGATVFEVGREIAADFDEFVARVDVAEGIALMADYLGGRRVELGPAPAGEWTTRVRQAERNLYLPQPNYLAAWGGEPIDVCKIELVERRPDEHRLLWRTVRSPNSSAAHDDGSLTFTRTGTGTLATVRGRQLFTLPPSWQGLDLTLVPEVRNPLLEEAYRRFFTTTFDNLEARFEGRGFRIGRPPPDPDEPLLTRSVELLLTAAQDWVSERSGLDPDPVGSTGERSSRTPEADEVDVHGFRHVRGGRDRR
ncbi:hypothetical protein [uncultured Phycicoccus sp.]|uniref:hypothetical protein n=1 Tax=uncultured Phycicoccus sp. TaxID=661422 RepID=UPI0026140FF2|nr:hypothetical protein [uncultured Phycicoccus sp.]